MGNKKDKVYEIIIDIQEQLENILTNLDHYCVMLDDGIKWVEEEE